MKAQIVILFLRVMSIFPLWAIHSIAFVIGNLLFLLPSQVKITTNTNLQLCFPEFNSKQINMLLRKTLIENCKTALEFGYIWFRDPQVLLTAIVSSEGEETVIKDFELGNGLIFAAPHLGQWEIAGIYLAKKLPCCYMYKKPQIEQLDSIMVKARQRNGAKLVPADKSGVRQLFQYLKQGMALGILPDQDPSAGEGVFAPFFGVPAKTMILLSRFAAKTNAPVFVTHVERLPFARGFKIHFNKIEGNIHSKDLVESTSELNKAIEKEVTKIPAQYQWTYKRFKSRPEGEQKVY